MEAQELIARSRTRAGTTDAEIEAALETCEPRHPEHLSEDEVYLGTLARFVTALGGRLEVSAVFHQETIRLAQ